MLQNYELKQFVIYLFFVLYLNRISCLRKKWILVADNVKRLTSCNYLYVEVFSGKEPSGVVGFCFFIAKIDLANANQT